jgi:hypothetical protein
MKSSDDNKTIDMLSPGSPGCRQRGRPVTGNALSPAERQRKRRQLRAETHGSITVELPLDLLEQFREFLKFKDVTQDAVIERLIRGQLLRKR